MTKPKPRLKNPIKAPLEKIKQQQIEEAEKLYQAIQPRVLKRIVGLRTQNRKFTPQDILEILEQDFRNVEIELGPKASQFRLAAEVFIVGSLEVRRLAHVGEDTLEFNSATFLKLRNSLKIKQGIDQGQGLIIALNELYAKFKKAEPLNFDVLTKPKAKTEFADSLISNAVRWLPPIPLSWPETNRKRNFAETLRRMFRK